MTGLVLGGWLPASRALLVAACWGVLCLYLALYLLKTPSSLTLRSGALFLLVLLFGWARVESNPLPGVESVVTEEMAGAVELTGTVAEDPLPGRSHKGAAYRFPLRVESVRVDGTEPVPAHGQIEVLWFGSLAYGTSPAYGERWSLEGPLRAPRRYGRGGRYLLVSSNRKSRRLSRGVMAAVVQFCLGLRHGAAEALRVGVEDYPESVGMVQALLLGYRSELSAEAHRLFVRTGTLHIFAISGLHVGIVVGLIIFALAAMSVPRRWWVFVVAPLLIAYTLMTGMKPSAIRACIMAIVFLSAAALHRRADSLSALAFAALLLLSASPAMLTSPSFVLSFSVVAGIILLFPHIDRLVRPLWAPHPLIVEREKKSILMLRGIGKRVAALAAVSVSAWLISAPLIACYFGRVAPVALIANIFVVPMAFLVVLSGSLAIVLGLFLSIGPDLFNHATLALTHALMAGLRALAWIPGGCFKVGAVPLWFPAIWYGAIVFCLLYMHARLPDRDQPGIDVSEQ
ncbi:MAG: ComEC/Rec2 family competence protein [Kiritimatiellia bacterium]|nr:ComEC/Rec2 family competence protein [Kiritimatiellia bacterium]MDP7024841.1 ComEC/Rec2 family competence protein [Kiritimatiellia bacterium]